MVMPEQVITVFAAEARHPFDWARGDCWRTGLRVFEALWAVPVIPRDVRVATARQAVAYMRGRGGPGAAFAQIAQRAGLVAGVPPAPGALGLIPLRRGALGAMVAVCVTPGQWAVRSEVAGRAGVAVVAAAPKPWGVACLA